MKNCQQVVAKHGLIPVNLCLLFFDGELSAVSKGLFLKVIWSSGADVLWMKIVRMDAALNNVTLLTSSNSELWKIKITLLLMQFGAWQFIENPLAVVKNSKAEEVTADMEGTWRFKIKKR